MLLLQTILETRKFIAEAREQGKSIGFVPTMGALHEGHLELVRKAGKENAIIIVSIFVNPIQFNHREDLEKYPRVIEADLIALKNTPCSAVFSPSESEMYPEPLTADYDFGQLDSVMEGKFRPGHFKGVGIVVKRLFDIVTPDRAYFGEKDYQQLAIIQHLVKSQNLPVKIIGCPTVREPDGLAMSSRNKRLTPEERAVAPAIFNSLIHAREKHSWFTPEGVEKMITGEIGQDLRFRVEYVQVADATTLMPVIDWAQTDHAVVCVAVYLGQVRLIDNIQLY